MKMSESAMRTHAPSRNLRRKAEKYSASIILKNTTKAIARITFWCQCKTKIRDIKQVVTNMIVIPVKPDHDIVKSIKGILGI
ncbi:hypothetical protein HanIR_Chr01g0013361 [Helianthus annuus]|nr:hypothetical protein HanIR_Chr01g0013361 [Helianthus annuus]